jgi:hypothetical protein
MRGHTKRWGAVVDHGRQQLCKVEQSGRVGWPKHQEFGGSEKRLDAAVIKVSGA